MKADHLLAASIGVVAFGAMAMASPTFSQGFEDAPFANGTTITNTTLGDTTSTGGGWKITANSIENLPLPTVVSQVDGKPVHSGTQSLWIPNGGENMTLYGHTTNSSIADDAVVETIVWVHWTSGASDFQFKIGGSASTDGRPGIWVNSNGVISNYTADTSQLNNSAISQTGWYGFKFETDLAAKTFDLYVDSGSGFTQVADDVAASNVTAGDVNKVLFKPKGGDGFYVDDVSVSIIPEPATSALLILGGWACLSKRPSR